MKAMRKSMTLLELLVVVIIVGIVATFAVSRYDDVAKISVQTKARHALSLIAEAENARRADPDFNAYSDIAAATAAADLVTLSADSGISLEGLSADQDWIYTAEHVGAPYVIQAEGRTGRLSAGTTIKYDLTNNLWS